LAAADGAPDASIVNVREARSGAGCICTARKMLHTKKFSFGRELRLFIEEIYENNIYPRRRDIGRRALLGKVDRMAR